MLETRLPGRPAADAATIYDAGTVAAVLLDKRAIGVPMDFATELGDSRQVRDEVRIGTIPDRLLVDSALFWREVGGSVRILLLAARSATYYPWTEDQA